MCVLQNAAYLLIMLTVFSSSMSFLSDLLNISGFFYLPQFLTSPLAPFPSLVEGLSTSLSLLSVVAGGRVPQDV